MVARDSELFEGNYMPKAWSLIGKVVLLTVIACPVLAQPSNTGVSMDYTAVFDMPPKSVPTNAMPDGPLLGNGDVGVALAGPPEAQRFHIGKNDFWTRHQGDAKVITVGSIKLSIPALQGAAYRQEQDLARAEVRGTFAKEGLAVRTRSWVDPLRTCCSRRYNVTARRSHFPCI